MDEFRRLQKDINSSLTFDPIAEIESSLIKTKNDIYNQINELKILIENMQLDMDRKPKGGSNQGLDITELLSRLNEIQDRMESIDKINIQLQQDLSNLTTSMTRMKQALDGKVETLIYDKFTNTMELEIQELKLKIESLNSSGNGDLLNMIRSEIDELKNVTITLNTLSHGKAVWEQRLKMMYVIHAALANRSMMDCKIAWSNDNISNIYEVGKVEDFEVYSKMCHFGPWLTDGIYTIDDLYAIRIKDSGKAMSLDKSGTSMKSVILYDEKVFAKYEAQDSGLHSICMVYYLYKNTRRIKLYDVMRTEDIVSNSDYEMQNLDDMIVYDTDIYDHKQHVSDPNSSRHTAKFHTFSFPMDLRMYSTAYYIDLTADQVFISMSFGSWIRDIELWMSDVYHVEYDKVQSKIDEISISENSLYFELMSKMILDVQALKQDSVIAVEYQIENPGTVILKKAPVIRGYEVPYNVSLYSKKNGGVLSTNDTYRYTKSKYISTFLYSGMSDTKVNTYVNGVSKKRLQENNTTMQFNMQTELEIKILPSAETTLYFSKDEDTNYSPLTYKIIEGYWNPNLEGQGNEEDANFDCDWTVQFEQGWRATRYILKAADRDVKLKFTILPDDAMIAYSKVHELSVIDVYLPDGKVVNDISVTWKPLNVITNGVSTMIFQGEASLNGSRFDAKPWHVVTKPEFNESTFIRIEKKGLAPKVTHNLKESVSLNSNTTVSLEVEFKLSHALNQFKFGHHTILADVTHTQKELSLAKMSSVWGKTQLINYGNFFMSAEGLRALNDKDMKVIFKGSKYMINVTYLRNPIGSGYLEYSDYDKMRLEVGIQNLLSQIINLSKLIDDQNQRISMVELYVNKASNDNGFASALANAAALVSMINVMAGTALGIVALVYTAVDMAKRGISAEETVLLITNTLQIVISLRVHIYKGYKFITAARGKYDVAKKASKDVINMTIPVENIKLSPQFDQVKYEKIGTIMHSYDVDHFYRGMEKFDKNTPYFKRLAEKVSNGSASKAERTTFKILDKHNVYPAHQMMKATTIREEGGTVFKDTVIFGVADGVSTPTTYSLIGNNKTTFFKKHNDDITGPGYWRISMKNIKDDTGSSSGTWQLMPYRSSGMSRDEILTAAGYSLRERNKFSQNFEPHEAEEVLERIYTIKSLHLSEEYDKYLVNSERVRLRSGQMEALISLVKYSQSDYNYSLIGNNCQDFVKSLTKLMMNPSEKPKWVNEQAFTKYLQALDGTF